MSHRFTSEPCGCTPRDTSGRIENPPGLSAIAYRCGTHPDVLARMLARLSSLAIEVAPGELRYPLTALTTRTPDDPAIALLDAWATAADVLTFYQERLANEGFLRTATERRSILELARLIGYELNPGVAAGVHLAYSVDTAAGAPAIVTVPAGSRVQSVPGQNELPQTFETAADLTARVEWNALRPRQMRPQSLAISGGTLYLLAIGAGAVEGGTSLDTAATHPLDASTPLPAGGTVTGIPIETLYVHGTSTNLRPGDVILLAGRRAGADTTETLVRSVSRVQEEDDRQRTRVDFQAGIPPAVVVLHVAGNLATGSIQQSALNSGTVDSLIVNRTWSDRDLNAWMSVQGWSSNAALTYIYGVHSNPRPKTQLSQGDPGAFAMRARLGFFGHNAPAFASIKDAANAFVNWDAGSGLSIWRSSMKPSTGNDASYYSDADCFLERTVPGITDGSWAVLERPSRQYTPFRVSSAVEASVAGYALSARSTGLRLARADNGETLADSTDDKSESFRTRKTTAHVLSDRLTLAQLPIDTPLGRGTPEETQLTLDRMVLNLRDGQPLIVTGERADLPGVTVSEVVTLDRVEHSGGFTTLYFASPGLKFQYVRSTVTMNANVVPATHGESVTEVLGSGDGGRPHQRFALRKPPLTYTSAATDTGATSSLEIRVNGVRWRETASLTAESPTAECYEVQIQDDGRAEVIFGDGIHGARLPTGIENVVACYRNGVGEAGMVGAERLTMLMTRPLGIRGVTNPVAASGAADPEARDAARENAPQTVLAMGRIVSLADAEHFVNAFAGIGKARARALWRAGTRWIHVTVAAEAAVPGDGTLTGLADHRLAATAPLRQNLEAAIARSQEPGLRIRLDTYQPVFFNIGAKVLIDERYTWPDVERELRAALETQFSFSSRHFGEPVSLSRVISVMQHVAGVVLVDVDALHRFDAPPSLPPNGRIQAGGVVWPEDAAAPAALAELLLVNPLGISLTPVSPEAVAS